jgi:uroporphyrinogen-III synthase
VLVTRPEEQADDLVARLRELGAEPVICPTIQIAPPASLAPLDAAVERLASYDWVIFTSVNGVRYFFERMVALGYGSERLAERRLAAIGPATAAALAEHGLEVSFVPRQYVAEAIVAEIGDVAGQRILLPRADIARKALAEGLHAKGAQVDEVTAYTTVAATGAADNLPAEPVDIATFTSPSTVRNFASLVETRGQSAADFLAGARIVCIGPITARAAAGEGLQVDMVAAEHTVPGLLAAIVEHYGQRMSR